MSKDQVIDIHVPVILNIPLHVFCLLILIPVIQDQQ